jgi:hypothetical protein
MPKELGMYWEKKELSTKLASYIPKEIRPRYKEVMDNFYSKYERCFQNKEEGAKVQEKIKPKDIKKRIDEIAKRRTELKKIAKKKEIDQKLQKGQTEGEKKEVIFEGSDKSCIVCYGTDNLFVSKCLHYACKSCWEQWLDRYLECPKCRNRVRKNQIFPLSQESIFKNN